MTASNVVYLDPFRPRRAQVTQIPIACPDLDRVARAVPVSRVYDGSPHELLTVEVHSPDGLGEIRRTAPARDLAGLTFGMPNGAFARFANHYRVHDVLFARLVTPFRVYRYPLNQLVLFPDIGPEAA
jgi:hypothetical protein